jgi:hypothetical protein
MKLKVNSKHGDFPDVIILLIFMFIFGIGLFVIAYASQYIFQGMNTAGMNNSVEGRTAINTMLDYGINGIQRGFVMIFVGLVLGTFITSFFSRVHPIFLFLNIIFLLIAAILSVFLSNAYETLSTSSAFSAFVASQPLINMVMGNALMIIIIVGIVDIIIVGVSYSMGGTPSSPI